jgi:hypothetical protein
MWDAARGDLQGALSTRPRCRQRIRTCSPARSRTSSSDEAQELTDAEWQMLLLRCPSRSFTDRRRPRPGPARVHRVVAGAARADRARPDHLATLSINYRTPEEVMAEAEPVIRAVLPDANVPTSIRSSGVPSCTVRRGAGPILDTWLAEHAEGIACVIGDPAFRGDAARPVADPGAVEGARVRPGRASSTPETFGERHRGRGRPLRRDDPGRRQRLGDPSYELVTGEQRRSTPP